MLWRELTLVLLTISSSNGVLVRSAEEKEEIPTRLWQRLLLKTTRYHCWLTTPCFILGQQYLFCGPIRRGWHHPNSQLAKSPRDQSCSSDILRKNCEVNFGCREADECSRQLFGHLGCPTTYSRMAISFLWGGCQQRWTRLEEDHAKVNSRNECADLPNKSKGKRVQFGQKQLSTFCWRNV